MFNVRLAGDHVRLWKIAVRLAVAGDVLMVSFVLTYFLRDVLDNIFDLIESVSKDFPIYVYKLIQRLGDEIKKVIITGRPRSVVSCSFIILCSVLFDILMF